MVHASRETRPLKRVLELDAKARAELASGHGGSGSPPRSGTTAQASSVSG
jgi:hypothetical protein